MTSDSIYRIRKPDVIFESFGNEIVLINLENGNYYSIQDVAAEIWGLIENCTPPENIINYVTVRYEGAQKEIAESVDLFIAALIQDGLIETFEPEAGMVKGASEKTEQTGNRPSFVAPTLNRYTDMQNLLLLDPIHDVGEQGWPHQQSGGSPVQK